MSGYVLIADQDRSIRLCILETLQNIGLELKSAASGDECLKLSFSGDRPSLIILGWKMPVLSGLEILTLLKLNERSQAIPVIMVGGEKCDEEQAITAGAYASLPIPLESEILRHYALKALG
ncbi:response regulator [Desulfitobacterium sp.]|uniref:response regulator n=1 Tax=Desulfitobacterium sp. TaxID=49981 RepID=UPI002B21F3D4|nr:response regulator [Desulfitobacterium sp.]MEA4902244.1 response regulator [Desulfitobacterium sp.]